MNSETEKTAAEKAIEILQITPEQWKNVERIPLFRDDGLLWPTFSAFRTKGIGKAVKDVMNLQTRDTDVLVCTYSKSGTQWIYEIAKMLLENSSKLDRDSKVNTMLEALPDLSVLDAMSSPRLLDKHYMFQYIPVKHIEKRNKTIHMVRNPKDVLVSLYYHGQKDVLLNLDVPYQEYFDNWMSGKMPYGSWYDYELGREQAETDYPGMIYTCYYEDMKKREIGDWKNHLTVAKNERFDAQYEEKTKDSKYKLTFE